MHRNSGVPLGCTDCHGGNSSIMKPASGAPSKKAYRTAMDQAHVQPRYPQTWNYPSSANPVASYTLLNKESPEYVRFVNPSDYRIVEEACGSCHAGAIRAQKTVSWRRAQCFGVVPHITMASCHSRTIF
ncbi:MAG: hypothetical protein CM15mP62_29460 [Rhodospirillaceae bacterium]|nr:MAG: hypothetical protein CM15mP62_29460 [Rhodospirillaceae bacterium]